MNKNQMKELIDYIKEQGLILATAESCTAGEIMSTIAHYGNCGDCLYIGFVVYNSDAKKKLLHVKAETIQQYTLTSEEVAKEMALGVFRYEGPNVSIATTGLTGDKSMDGIPPGTICFAWGFKDGLDTAVYSDTLLFDGSTKERCHRAVAYALSRLKHYHQHFKGIKDCSFP